MVTCSNPPVTPPSTDEWRTGDFLCANIALSKKYEKEKILFNWNSGSGNGKLSRTS